MPYRSSAEAIAEGKGKVAEGCKDLLAALLAIMWLCLAKGYGRREYAKLAKPLRKATVRIRGDGVDYAPRCSYIAAGEFSRLKAKSDAMAIEQGDAEGAYRLLKKEKEWQRLQTHAYAMANDYEERAKAKALGQLRIYANAKSPWPERQCFALCSRHGDCAEDHKEWQGRLYYDKFWKRNFPEKEAREAIGSFIEAHGLIPWQAITNRPVWLITRPNCRHWLQPISAKEALEANGDFEAIFKAYGLDAEAGPRGSLQTIKHPINEGWYTKGNVEGIILRYREREKALAAMKAKASCPTLEADLRKTRFLIAKWRGYLKRFSDVL